MIPWKSSTAGTLPSGSSPSPAARSRADRGLGWSCEPHPADGNRHIVLTSLDADCSAPAFERGGAPSHSTTHPRRVALVARPGPGRPRGHRRRRSRERPPPHARSLPPARNRRHPIPNPVRLEVRQHDPQVRSIRLNDQVLRHLRLRSPLSPNDARRCGAWTGPNGTGSGGQRSRCVERKPASEVKMMISPACVPMEVSGRGYQQLVRALPCRATPVKVSFRQESCDEDERDVDRGQIVGDHRGRKMSVTEPSSAPKRSATSVSGQRKPFAAKIRLSPPTTTAATAARRSDRCTTPNTADTPCTTRWRTRPAYGWS